MSFSMVKAQLIYFYHSEVWRCNSKTKMKSHMILFQLDAPRWISANVVTFMSCIAERSSWLKMFWCMYLLPTIEAVTIVPVIVAALKTRTRLIMGIVKYQNLQLLLRLTAISAMITATYHDLSVHIGVYVSYVMQSLVVSILDWY